MWFVIWVYCPSISGPLAEEDQNENNTKSEELEENGDETFGKSLGSFEVHANLGNKYLGNDAW